MPTQEYAADAAGKSRVQVYREYEGGDLTVLLDRVIVGSVLTEENGERKQEFPLDDGSVLKVQVLEDQVQVLKDGEVLAPVPPAAPEQIKPRRAETTSQTIYVLAHPTITTFDEEIFEASWGGIWGRVIGYSILFLLVGAAPILGPIISAFSPVYLVAILVLAIIFGATVTGLFFLATGIPYFLAKRLGGKASFMEHTYLLSIFLVTLVIFPFIIPLLGLLYQVFTSGNQAAALQALQLPHSQLSQSLVQIQTIFELVLLPLSVYYFVLATVTLMSVHKLKLGRAAITAFVSFALIWLAVLGLTFVGYLFPLAHFYFQTLLPKV
jgi:hypothetical protein